LEGIVIEAYNRAKRTLIFSTRLEGVLGFIDETHNPALQGTRDEAARP
jgi:hypothetical protein